MSARLWFLALFIAGFAATAGRAQVPSPASNLIRPGS